MEKIRCLVVDDEPLALDILANYINQTPSLTLVGTSTDALEALSLIQQGKIDLVFLDIQMPALTGLQFLRVVNGKCKAILTTAYSEYAMEGYELDVIDYLLKPISFERFLKAVQKAVNRLQVNGTSAGANTEVNSVSEVQLLQHEPQPNFLFVKTEYKIIKLDLADILYIEGLKDYVSIYTGEERILTLQTMKKMEELLPSGRFARVHKSYIVSLEKISSIERQRIFVGRATIPIGESYYKDFIKQIGTG
ncbi:LytTR family DNA-binding domain-containing protein [Emticicia sp. TH156]|uniref:LytR/AlgR family response regulator transcription factor n=1 Tax=Emticicia sp. TH156 TaxID=2067454 RepID=UPI000C76C680|nr:LytTR family DNA-binding domain-containing protein [Emticicia sp. TH156]PLK42318.1 DNA-binding response regulator [Emticicia sp. TH156]